MTRYKRFAAFIFFVIFGITSAQASYKVVLQASHEGAPVALGMYGKTGEIVSLGEDGRLIAVNPGLSRITHRFQVSRSPVEAMQLNPAAPKAAVLIQKDKQFRVEVWNWEKEKKEYSYTLQSEPLFVQWSARGRYLIIGNLGSPSIIILEGRTGRRLSYLQRLPGIYNQGYIGSTESIIMTYASSGAIQYRDIRSSALKLEAFTESGLNGLSVLQSGDKSTVLGHKNETLYLFNRQSGEILQSMNIPDMSDISVDTKNGDIDVLSVSPSGAFLHQFNAADGIMTEDAALRLPSSIHPVKILRCKDTSYIMDTEGRLYRAEIFPDNQTAMCTPVIQNRTWKPESLNLYNDNLFLDGSGRIMRFTSPFFASRSASGLKSLTGSSMSFSVREPESRKSATRMSLMPDGRLVQWDTENAFSPAGIGIFGFDEPGELSGSVAGTISDLKILDHQRLMVLYRSGMVSILDAGSFSEEYSYSALGILDAAVCSDDTLLLGRSSAGRSGSPLEKVDMQTGETIPVSDSRFMIYKVTPSPEGILTIGVDRQGQYPRTVLKLHNRSKPENSRTLAQIKGEYLNACVLPLADRKGFFTAVENQIVGMLDNRKIRLQWNKTITRLGFHGQTLYGIDEDGTVILWNTRTSQEILHVHLFQDNNWLAVSADNTKIWYSSPDCLKNVLLYKDGRQIRALR